MRVRFTKMHGLGNDFVVINAVTQRLELTPERARHIGDRRRGIGCDQILLVEQPRMPGTDFRYRIFNADGSEVEQCGNGARCFARYVRDAGLTDQDQLALETAGGVIRTRIEADGQVTVNMGVPRFDPEDIPFEAPSRQDSYGLEVSGRKVSIGVVSLGNPHAVLRVQDVDTAPVTTLGPIVEAHERFPRRVNVGFMEVVDRTRIRLRVFERGAGETLACGTGACAAAVVGQQQGLLDNRVRVHLAGGELLVHWDGEQQPVWLTGPTSHVFEGCIDL